MTGLDLEDLDPLVTRLPGYLSFPIPSEMDNQISALLEKARTTSEVDTLAELISPRESMRLCVYSERMSVLAVRRNDSGALRLAILAIGIAACGGNDPRENLLVVSLPWRSAQILNLDPSKEFQVIARLLPSVSPHGDEEYPQLYGAEFLLTWANRAPEDQAIRVMGYREIDTPDGFMYERTW